MDRVQSDPHKAIILECKMAASKEAVDSLLMEKRSYETAVQSGEP